MSMETGTNTNSQADDELENDNEKDMEMDDDMDVDLEMEERDSERESEGERANVDNDVDLELDTPMASERVGEEDKFAEVKPEHLGLRNFRSHPDFENFYRFVNEYNLRREAFISLDKVLVAMGSKKKKIPKSSKKPRKH